MGREGGKRVRATLTQWERGDEYADIVEVMVNSPRIAGLTDWRPLARGGFAVVFSARQESLNRPVAVKVDQRRLDTPADRERFLREAGAAGRMSGHPGIVTVHDAGLLSDDRPYLVMELCTGGSLTRCLEPEHRPDVQWVREVGVRIADALAAAHAQGVLHRDVKPANVLIDGYGHAGLADFGLALLPDPEAAGGEAVEALTPAYAPPETLAPHAPTEAGDVYSLAATLYALLCGHPPRAQDNGPTDLKTALARLQRPVQPLPGVDRGLMAVLLGALADDPADRPAAAAFRDALAALPLGASKAVVLAPVLTRRSGRRAASTTAVQARHAAPPDPPARHGSSRWAPQHARRRSRVPIVLAAVSVGVLLGTGLLLRTEAEVASGPAPVRSVAAKPPATSSSGVTPSPPPSPALPSGFIGCGPSATGALCGPEPAQCWGGLPSAFDAPIVATPASCRKNHVYQTFAAGRLDFAVRRQSQLDDDADVQKVCSLRTVNDLLAPGDRRSDWEVYAIPPQTEQAADVYFRCVFGRGERDRPIRLIMPS